MALIRSEAVGDNSVTKRFYHRLTPFLQTLLLREKMHSTGFGSGVPCRTVKAPALNNRSYYSPASAGY